jgi:hypothetical protein
MTDLIEKIQNLVEENKALKQTVAKQSTLIHSIDDANTDQMEKIEQLKLFNANQLSELYKCNDEIRNLKSNAYTKQGHNDTILRARLKQMGVNYDHFKSIFEVKDTVMAGGLITQIMTGDTWQTDIDIFTTNIAEVVRRLTRAFGYWIQPLHQLSAKDAYAKKYGYKSLNMFQGKYTKNVSVDIIECRTVNSAIRDFDLEFVKCYFDGVNFHTHNEEAVITKTHQAETTNADAIRQAKYEMRGFDIIPALIMPVEVTQTTTDPEYKPIPTQTTILKTPESLRKIIELGESSRRNCSRHPCPIHDTK